MTATLTPSFAQFLPAWVASQRWYAGKGGDVPRLERVGGLRIEDPDGEVGIEVCLVLDTSGSSPTMYQLPFTYRADPLPGAEHALVATAEHSDLGTRYVYDGPHDPVFAEQLLALLRDGATVVSDGAPGTGEAAGRRRSGIEIPYPVSSRVLRAEQSNTSIVYEMGDGGPPLIAKLFRVLTAGDNPEVHVQAALAEVGCALVPEPIGQMSGTWPDPRSADGTAQGDLVFVQEFLTDARDGWAIATAAAKTDDDFGARARSLGTVTARIHGSLREAMGTSEAGEQDVAQIRASWDRRHTAAVTQVSSLASSDQTVKDVYDQAEAVRWPALQRVHGDYHLGQVLDVPGRGWVVVDFEGEPLRPLAERTLPDLALRDVAGMLRSFDYAAGSAEQAGAASRDGWAHAAREAFLDGYAAEAGHDPRSDRELLDALELDKAMYELDYESRNRPTWVGIPRAAITRLLDSRHRPEPDTHPIPRGQDELWHLVAGDHGDPHSVLGAHTEGDKVTVRALRPWARSVRVELPDGGTVDLVHEHEGVWVGVLPTATVPDYRLLVTYEDGYEHRQDDPYRFLPTLGDVDQHLIGEGRHEQLWTVLGSHIHEYQGPLGSVHGTAFAVWAPRARGVRVVGDFNRWDGTSHPMRALGSSGIWELFVPEVGEGTRYKYEILGRDGVRRAKADPMARAAEIPPASASIVTATHHEWGDDAWLARRGSHDPHSDAMSVYEVHLGSWRQGLSYVELADQLVSYVSDLGFTHVELLPVMEHPYGPSWGYHVTGYYAPTSRFGSPDEFRYLVDALHRGGIGVILDWVPGHFATDPWALMRFDGEALYEHPDPRKGWHAEWGSYIFDFGRPQVRNFLAANATYWLEEFHADGLRVDGVASMLYLDYSRKEGEWIPNMYGGRENLEAVQLLQETNATTYRRVPGTVMVAEESTSWPGVTRPTHLGGLGFGLKWNMGWMHDTLDYMANAPIYRQYHHHQMTFSLMYAWSEQFVLPISHDEVVHGKGSLLRKMPGDRWQQLASVRAMLAYMWSHPGKQLLFMGSEFAQEAEWADGRSLDWWLLDQPAHWGVHAMLKDANRLYTSRPALWALDNDPTGFQWIDANDSAGNTFSYLRFGRGERTTDAPVVASVVNFSGTPHGDYRIGLPRGGQWDEILNTDSQGYGGSGVGNLGAVQAEQVPWHGQPFSTVLTLPSLGALWLEPHDEPVTKTATADAVPQTAPVSDKES